MNSEKYNKLISEKIRIENELNSLKTIEEQNSVKYQNLSKKAMLEIEKVIVGQQSLIKKLMIAVVSGGHVLVEGAPGLAKTLALKCLAQVCELTFKRIQFTPDLLPSDLVGTKIYNPSNGSFSTEMGPLFANLVLADEINRAPAKVQSALLESMAENQITIGKETHKLPSPYLVVATQNPIENEGTYNLPEAQLDRFLFKVIVDYPSQKEEKSIIERISNSVSVGLSKVLSGSDIQEMMNQAKFVHVDENLVNYIANVVCETRKPNENIMYGASPRASISITNAAKANALISGRSFVEQKDILGVVKDCLRHRISLSYEAISNNITTGNIIDEIISTVKL